MTKEQALAICSGRIRDFTAGQRRFLEDRAWEVLGCEYDIEDVPPAIRASVEAMIEYMIVRDDEDCEEFTEIMQKLEAAEKAESAIA